MKQELYQHTFSNGLTLLAERMPHVRSASLGFLIPAGCVYDPNHQLGLSSVLMEILFRGAGNYSSRALSNALNSLGIDHSEGSGLFNSSLSASMLSKNLEKALDLYANIILAPHLPESEMDAVKNLLIQDIEALEDEPQQKVMIELTRHYYPNPINRYKRGTIEGVQNTDVASLRKQHKNYFQPDGTILAIAGDFEWSRLRDHVQRLFGDWKANPVESIQVDSNNYQSVHLSKEIEQTQIALAFPSVPVSDPDFYKARGAVGVWSLDMSSRLFTNIREKYGLCYSVYASYESLRDRGTIVVYAGATPEKAQETLNRTLQELRILKDGIEDEEVDRVKVGLKSALIMRQESTAARAGAIASDWYFLKRVRPLQEIQTHIDQLSTKSIIDYAERYPPFPLSLVTLGPKELQLNH